MKILVGQMATAQTDDEENKSSELDNLILISIADKDNEQIANHIYLHSVYLGEQITCKLPSAILYKNNLFVPLSLIEAKNQQLYDNIRQIGEQMLVSKPVLT